MTAPEGSPPASDREDHDGVNPLEAALDVFVYAPLGFALSAADEVPKLAAVGRSHLEQRVKTARVIGRFAVEEGRRQIEQRLGDLFGASGDGSPPEGAGRAEGVATDPSGAPETAEAPGPATAAAAAGVAAEPAPDVSSLAIPGYDSLSASQVVQRLDGLEEAELEDVRLYEEASRGRRTILSRIQQLQAG